MTVVSAYLPSVNKVTLANRLVLMQHGLIVLAAALGSTMSLAGFIACYSVACWVTNLLLAYHMAKNRFRFVPKSNPWLIAAYSIALEPDQIAAVSIDAQTKLQEYANQIAPEELKADLDAALGQLCMRVSLIVEDSLGYISQFNEGNEVSADVELIQREKTVRITILDNGSPYNPFAESLGADLSRPGALESEIVLSMSAEAEYDRVLELNQMSLLVKAE